MLFFTAIQSELGLYMALPRKIILDQFLGHQLCVFSSEATLWILMSVRMSVGPSGLRGNVIFSAPN